MNQVKSRTKRIASLDLVSTNESASVARTAARSVSASNASITWTAWADANLKKPSGRLLVSAMSFDSLASVKDTLIVSASEAKKLAIGVNYDATLSKWVGYSDFSSNFFSQFRAWAGRGVSSKLLKLHSFLTEALLEAANSGRISEIGDVDMDRASHYGVQVGITIGIYLKIMLGLGAEDLYASITRYITIDNTGYDPAEGTDLHIENAPIKCTVSAGLKIGRTSTDHYIIDGPANCSCHNNRDLRKSSVLASRDNIDMKEIISYSMATQINVANVKSRFSSFVNRLVTAFGGQTNDMPSGFTSVSSLLEAFNRQVDALASDPETKSIRIMADCEPNLLHTYTGDTGVCEDSIIISGGGISTVSLSDEADTPTPFALTPNCFGPISIKYAPSANEIDWLLPTIQNVEDYDLAPSSRLVVKETGSSIQSNPIDGQHVQLTRTINQAKIALRHIRDNGDADNSMLVVTAYSNYYRNAGAGEVAKKGRLSITFAAAIVTRINSSTFISQLGDHMPDIITFGDVSDNDLSVAATDEYHSGGHWIINFHTITPTQLGLIPNATASMQVVHYKPLDTLTNQQKVTELSECLHGMRLETMNETLNSYSAHVRHDPSDATIEDVRTTDIFDSPVLRSIIADCNILPMPDINVTEILKPKEVYKKYARTIFDMLKHFGQVTGKYTDYFRVNDDLSMEGDSPEYLNYPNFWDCVPASFKEYITANYQACYEYLLQLKRKSTVAVKASVYPYEITWAANKAYSSLTNLSDAHISKSDFLDYNAPIPEWIILTDEQIRRINSIHANRDQYKDNMTEREVALAAVSDVNRQAGLLTSLLDYVRSRGKISSIMNNGFPTSDVFRSMTVSEFQLKLAEYVNTADDTAHAANAYVRDQLYIASENLRTAQAVLMAKTGSELLTMSVNDLLSEAAKLDEATDDGADDAELHDIYSVLAYTDSICDAATAVFSEDAAKAVTRAAVLTYLQSDICAGMTPVDAVNSMKESVESNVKNFISDNDEFSELLNKPEFSLDTGFINTVSNYIRGGMGQEDVSISTQAYSVRDMNDSSTLTGTKVLVDMLRQDIMSISAYAASNDQANLFLTNVMHIENFVKKDNIAEAAALEEQLGCLNLNLYSGRSPLSIACDMAISVAGMAANTAATAVCAIVGFVGKAWKAIANKLDSFLNYISMRDLQSFSYSSAGVMPTLDVCLYAGEISKPEAQSILEWAYYNKSGNGNVAILPVTPHSRIVIMPHPYISDCYAYGLYIGPKSNDSGGDGSVIENDLEFITGMYDSFVELITYINKVGKAAGCFVSDIIIDASVKSKFEGLTSKFINDYKTSPDRLLSNSVAATATCAAIGAGIGSFFGPLGTFVGGLVGGVVGLGGSVIANACTPVDAGSEQFQRYANAQLTNQDLASASSVIVESIGSAGHRKFADVIGAMIGVGLCSCFTDATINSELIRQSCFLTSTVPSASFHIFTDAEVESQTKKRAITLGLTILAVVSAPLIIKGGKALAGSSFKAVNNFISKRRQSRRITNSVVSALTNGTCTEAEASALLEKSEMDSVNEMLTKANFGEAALELLQSPPVLAMANSVVGATKAAYSKLLANVRAAQRGLPSI